MHLDIHDLNHSQNGASLGLLVQSAQPGIQVSGNTVSWSSDNWYEVQYASSFNTVSEGGRSTTLEPGAYNVINHTTGERFENVIIGQDAGTAFQSRTSLEMFRDSPTTAETISRGASVVYGPGGIRDNGSEPSTVTTVTPESTWPEVARDAARDGAYAGGAAWRAGGTPPVIAEVAIGAALVSVLNNIDTKTEPNPNNTGSGGSDTQGEATSSESADSAGFGTDTKGEFGGTPTQPVAESAPTPPSRRSSSGNENSDYDRSSRESNSQSSRESAESAGFGTSEQGEFG